MPFFLLRNNVPRVLPRIGGGADAASHSPVEAGLILAAYAVVFVAIALVLYRRRDIGSSQ